MQIKPRRYNVALTSTQDNNQTSERIMVIENLKWGLIAAAIWFGIYHAATVIGITSLF